MTRNSPYEVAAYYFPQYHTDSHNDAWHGEGWDEWELLKSARPRFPGHRQPVVPAWGYFDESDPAWAAREIDLAADYGITSFLYDWYWYKDGPFLHTALEDGFLRAPNRERLTFALMWANHDWINIHPATYTNHAEVLAPGRISATEFERLTTYVIEQYFSQPNYLKIDGAPYFSIYELGTFLSGMGGLEAACEALERFRARTRAAGFPDLHLNVVVWGISVLPSEIKLSDPAQVIAQLGFSSTTSYAWAHHYNLNGGRHFPVARYQEVAEANYAAWEEYACRFDIPYHPNVSMGWDPSPRTVQSDHYDPRGYPWTAVLTDNTPAAFKEALLRAKAFVDCSEAEPKMLTLNAWNEWTEGSYLLPDTVHGTAYLEAIRDVFGAREELPQHLR